MSSVTPAEVDLEAGPKPPAHYAERADAGDVTWIEDAIEDYLGLEVTAPQREICRAIAGNNKLLVVTANGLGKSYILAAITIVWLFCRYPAVAFATSGTERKMKRTYCKPVDNLHSNARIPLPGEYKSRPERIEVDGDPEHFFEAASPRDAGELEGVHSSYTLSIIEEGDKDDVDEDVIDAMRSLATDDQDRYLIIANPPEDETNSIYPYMDDHPEWEVLEFSTFDAHNVQVERGTVDGGKIDGIADLSKLRDDWVEYNGESWPGLEEALRTSAPRLDEQGDPVFANDDTLRENPDFRTDLGKRWYRRRAGIMPPAGASAHRPYSVTQIQHAYDLGESLPDNLDLPSPTASAIDVARSSDRTVLATIHGDVLVIHYVERGTNHLEQGRELEELLKEMPRHPITVDFIGHGSAIHDQLADVFPDVYKFEAGAEAVDGETYYDKWSEGNDHLGDWFAEGGVIRDGTLRKELLAAARELEFEEKHYATRGEDGAEVYTLSSKDDVKERLDNQSPDLLDGAMMAAWTAQVDLDELEDYDLDDLGWGS